MSTMHQSPPDRCLICYANIGATSTRKHIKPTQKQGISLNSSVLLKQLDSIFILKNLLAIPSENLQSYLMNWGNPETWISICAKCQVNVLVARNIHYEVVNACKRFRKVKMRIIEAIKKSKSEGPSTSTDAWKFPKRFITDMSRNFVSIHSYGDFTDPFIFGDRKANQLTNLAFDASDISIKIEAESNDSPKISKPSAFDNDIQDFVPEDECDDDYEADTCTFDDDLITPSPPSSDAQDIADINTSRKEIKEKFDWKNTEMKFCDKCQVNFLSTMFEKHTNIHHPTETDDVHQPDLEHGGESSCSKEAEICETGNTFKKGEDTKELFCVTCPRKFYRPEEFWDHQNLHKTSQYHCFICRSVHRKPDNLRFHLFKHHPTTRMGKNDPVKKVRKNNPVKKVRKNNPVANKNYTIIIEKMDTDQDLSNANQGGLQSPSTSKSRVTRKCNLKPTNQRRRTKFVCCPACNAFKFKSGEVEKLLVHWEICEVVKNANNENSSDQNLHCPLCHSYKTSFSEQSAFLEHLFICNENIGSNEPIPLTCRLFECNLCPSKVYFTLDNFMKHYVEHSRNIYKCIKCPRIFPITSQVQHHWSAKHRELLKNVQPLDRFTKEETSVPEVYWWCKLCNEKFMNEETRDSHIHSAHETEVPEKLHICQKCSKAYSCEDELKLHEGTIHATASLDLLTCDLCKQEFTTNKQLRNHRMRVHRVDLLVCETCGTECNSVNNLQVHMQLHQGVKRYVCQQCGQSFAIGQYLRNHILRKHTPHDAKINPLVCSYCEKVFNNKSYLNQHIASIHEGQFNMHCHLCNAGFHAKSKLTLHLAMKHNIGEQKKYTCTVVGCNKTFRFSSGFREHMSRHTGNPPYKCQFCEKAFHNRTHLRRHEQIHSNSESKPYQCHLCPKRFPVRNYLYIHMRSHKNDNK